METETRCTNPTSGDELLKPQQAADLLQVPISFIYERTRLNSIPVKRIGKYVRIPKAELLAWVEAQSPAV